MGKQSGFVASETDWTEQEEVVSERFRYEPYGQVAVADEGPGNMEADVGGWAWFDEHRAMPQDDASALYRSRNRDHSPSLGRWVQQDPMGYVDGMSLYEYVRSVPTEYVDPQGLEGFAFRPPPHQNTCHQMLRKPRPGVVHIRVDVISVACMPPEFGWKSQSLDAAAMTLSSLWSHLSRFSDVVIRADSLRDMTNKIKNFVDEADKDAVKVRISQLYIRAHGSDDGIFLGNDYIRITSIDKNSPTSNREHIADLDYVRSLMAPGSEIVLWTCYTGKDDFGKYLAEATQATVHSLDVKTDAHIVSLGLYGTWVTDHPKPDK